MSERQENGPPALDLAGVSHRYGRREALSGLALQVKAGGFHVLLGPNGAGKSTLVNLITRLFEVREGMIAIAGFDLRSAPQRALAALGVVFQSPSLDAGLTVRQNVVYNAALHGIGRREAERRGAEELARLDMADRLNETVAKLSGGQARRVEIACAMLHRPSLLVCDEATAGLDIGSRARLVDDLHALCARGGIAVLWATHLIDEVGPEDEVTILHEGKILRTGTASEIGDGDLTRTFLALTTGEAA